MCPVALRNEDIMTVEDVERREVLKQTCGDIMVYPLDRHSGICNGVPLLVFHNAPNATVYLHKKGEVGGSPVHNWVPFVVCFWQSAVILAALRVTVVPCAKR